MKNKSIVYIIGGIVGLGLIIGLAGKGTNFQGYLNFKKVPVNGNIDINKADKSPVKVGLSRSGFNEAKLKNVAESFTEDANSYDPSVAVGASQDQIVTNAGNYGTCTKVTLSKEPPENYMPTTTMQPFGALGSLFATVHFDDRKDYPTNIKWEASDLLVLEKYTDSKSSAENFVNYWWNNGFGMSSPMGGLPPTVNEAKNEALQKIKIKYVKVKVTGVDGAHNSAECQKGATLILN